MAYMLPEFDGGPSAKTNGLSAMELVRAKINEILKKRAQEQNAASSGSSSSNTSSGSYSSEGDSYDAYLAYMDKIASAQRQAQKDAIDSQVDQSIRSYQSNIPGIQSNYQTLRNESEVERYKAQKNLRENQANRGALDSGTGRQESLNLSNNFGNNLNKINLQEQSELDAINRAIEDVRSQGNIQKASIDAGGYGDMSDYLSSNMENYMKQFGGSSNARSAASGVVDKAKSNNATASNTPVYTGYNSNNQNAKKTSNALSSLLTSGKINSDDYSRLRKMALGTYYAR